MKKTSHRLLTRAARNVTVFYRAAPYRPATVRERCLFLCFLALAWAASLNATIIDRIAAVVNTHPIKDSDIDRDIRLTDFLNQESLDFGAAARKQAVRRLIEQTIIRREVDIGNYTKTTPEQVSKFLQTVIQQRFGGDQQRFREALRTYGITEEQLQQHLAWQLTVLSFIDERFRPAVLVPETDIDNYARTHPGVPRDQIQEQLAGERVNQQYDTWMQGAIKRAKIEYIEAGLQ